MHMPKLNLPLAFAILLAAASPLFAQNASSTVKDQEVKLIAVLKSDAPQKEKADACRELARIGTKDAVAPLAALLSDEMLGHMARYGLETIPDPSVDIALRDALGKLTGKPLVGVIGSLGVRRDAKAVKPLAGFLQASDAEVLSAAARAMGKIGTADAAKALRDALPKTAAQNQAAICEGLFRCAEALAKSQPKEALAIYAQLNSLPGLPHQIRSGALRGAILANGKPDLKLLKLQLASDDYLLFATAVRITQEIPGKEATETLVSQLNQPSADRQILVIQMLGRRADTAALPALLPLTKTEPKPVRLAALRALPQFGDAAAVPVLVDLMSDPDRELAKAAQEGLAGLPGHAADAAVMTMLNSNDTARRLTALDLMGRRRMTTSIPALIKAAGDTDAKIGRAAVKKLGELGSPAQLPVLLELLGKAKESADLDAAEQALIMICAKADKPELLTGKLKASLAQAPSEQKRVLLRVLNSIGGKDALQAVRASVKDADAEVRATAIRVLGAWKTADSAPDLLALAQTADNPTDKMLCLRSYLGLAANTDLPADQRLTMCRQVAGLVQKPEEKKLLLAALGSIQSPDALALIQPYLDDATIREEAASAGVTIADKLLKGTDASKIAGKLIEPLQKIVDANAGDDLTKRAQALLQKAKNQK
jgi:HEAT repeat protein